MSIGSIIHKIISFTKSASVKVSHVFAELVGSDKAAAFGHAALDVLKTAEGKVVLDAVIALQAVTPGLAVRVNWLRSRLRWLATSRRWARKCRRCC
jgi:hypothetical protein